MARTVPEPPLISVDHEIVSSRIDQRSATGSNLQRGMRKGSHYLATFVMAPVDHAGAKQWLDLRSEADTVIVHFPQMGIDIGNPGASPQVNGSGQAGTSLNVKGLTPGYVVRKGQALSHLGSDGVRRLYIAEAAVTANGSGVAVIKLETMLTWPPANNDAVSLADVRIEGFATVERGSWLQDGAGWHHIRFTVEEPG